jgi:ACS family sodium-dependent inorganic phosphate cotransporter
VQEAGWPSAFFIFGGVGVLWFLLWLVWAESSPAESARVSEEERAYIRAGAAVPEGAPEGPIPWREILSKREVWAIIVSHFCHNWGTFILLTWMPSYYHDELGFDLMESGLYSVLPWLGMIVVANAGGWLADSLISRGWSTTSVRRGMQTVGFLGPAFCLSQLSSVDEPLEAVALMVVSQSLDAFSQSGLYSNHQDIAPRYSGVLLGLSNTAGVLAGVLGTAATGYILQSGSWDDVWGVAVGLYLVGTVVWNLFSSGEQVID